MRNCLTKETTYTNSFPHDDNPVSEASLSSPLPEEEVNYCYNNLESEHVAEQPPQPPYFIPGPNSTTSFQTEIIRGKCNESSINPCQPGNIAETIHLKQ
jgi:hypothetical protein